MIEVKGLEVIDLINEMYGVLPMTESLTYDQLDDCLTAYRKGYKAECDKIESLQEEISNLRDDINSFRATIRKRNDHLLFIQDHPIKYCISRLWNRVKLA
jgi:hypothetical protein|tara:strand:- start:2856 stop:3155 length:300 start_codon:yes stop_codon:yes gene_type:complete